jgi:hypothetical protein
MVERAGDEIRSWFGDEEAERRRMRDERYDEGSSEDYWFGDRDRPNSSYDRRETRGFYRPDYDNDERGTYTADRSNWVSDPDRRLHGGQRYGERYDEEYGQRRRGYGYGRDDYRSGYPGTGTGSYQGSDRDRQSGYYGKGYDNDFERSGGYRRDRSYDRGDEQYRDVGYGQSQGGRNRYANTGPRYDDEYGGVRSGNEARGGRQLDSEVRRRGYGAQSGYDDIYENRGSRNAESRSYDARAEVSQSGYNAQGYGVGPETRQGPHAGKRPKNYQRSTERIHEDICERLMHNDRLDASEIDVKVENKEVTLTGTVSDWYSKRLAEEIAQGVAGVDDVMNQIRVRPADRSESQSGTSNRTPQTSAASATSEQTKSAGAGQSASSTASQNTQQTGDKSQSKS